MTKTACKVSKDRYHPYTWIVTFPESDHAPLSLVGPYMMMLFLWIGCGIKVEPQAIQNFDPSIISGCDIDALDSWKP